MKTIVCACMLAVLAFPVSAADPPGFAMWRASDLKGHDAALSKHIGDDHSSRETLADYKSHRFRMLYRDADGNPEQHDTIVDIVYVQSGEGTLVLGARWPAAGRRGRGSRSARGSTAANATPLARATSSIFPPAFRTASSCRAGNTLRTCC